MAYIEASYNWLAQSPCDHRKSHIEDDHTCLLCSFFIFEPEFHRVLLPKSSQSPRKLDPRELSMFNIVELAESPRGVLATTGRDP
jgi:hypothetical protein